MKCFSFSAMVFAVAGMVVAGSAQAVGTGLDGSYYSLGSAPGSNANALSAVAASSGPAATFTATSVCFPSCDNAIGDGSTLADFLGTSATNISANSITDLSAHAVVLTGYIYAPSAGSYSFTLGSDDGSEVWINNSQVLDNDGDHGFSTVTNNAVSLSQGLNAIKVLQFEDNGVTGLTLLEGGSALQTANLYPVSAVPLPAALPLLGAGVAGLAGIGWGRRRRPISA